MKNELVSKQLHYHWVPDALREEFFENLYQVYAEDFCYDEIPNIAELTYECSYPLRLIAGYHATNGSDIHFYEKFLHGKDGEQWLNLCNSLIDKHYGDYFEDVARAVQHYQLVHKFAGGSQPVIHYAVEVW